MITFIMTSDAIECKETKIRSIVAFYFHNFKWFSALSVLINYPSKITIIIIIIIIINVTKPNTK